jgi:arginase family enzyme
VSGWPNLSELVVGAETTALVGLVGAPLAAGSVTPGACDQAPALLRQTLRRIGRYDVETRRELSTQITDRGDVELAGPPARPEIANGR